MRRGSLARQSRCRTLHESPAAQKLWQASIIPDGATKWNSWRKYVFADNVAYPQRFRFFERGAREGMLVARRGRAMTVAARRPILREERVGKRGPAFYDDDDVFGIYMQSRERP